MSVYYHSLPKASSVGSPCLLDGPEETFWRKGKRWQHRASSLLDYIYINWELSETATTTHAVYYSDHHYVQLVVPVCELWTSGL